MILCVDETAGLLALEAHEKGSVRLSSMAPGWELSGGHDVSNTSTCSRERQATDNADRSRQCRVVLLAFLSPRIVSSKNLKSRVAERVACGRCPCQGRSPKTVVGRTLAIMR